MPQFARADVSAVPLGDTDTYPGERERHRTRETGVVVLILDTEIERPWLSNEGGRWATLCEEHGYYDNYTSLARARGWYAYPAAWCPRCADIRAGNARADRNSRATRPGSVG
jgi:hypothetical protein